MMVARVMRTVSGGGREGGKERILGSEQHHLGRGPHGGPAGVGREAPQGAPRIAYFMVGQKGDRGGWAVAGGGGNRILQGAVKRNLQLILYESCSPARVGREGRW